VHDSSKDVHGVMLHDGSGMLEHGERGTHEQVKVWKKGPQQNYATDLLGDESKLQTSTQSSSQESSAPYQQNTLKVFTCGAIAGTVQAFVICPMEHIKCRLQVQAAAFAATASASASAGVNGLAGARAFSSVAASRSQQSLYKGPVDCGLSIIKNHGLFRGLYRGMGVTLWRETPAFGMYFATYDSIKARVESLLEDKDEHHPIPSHAHAWAASALAGGISGAWTWAIIYPFDVIKSRIQTAPLERRLQKGMWTVARDIVEENGWKYMFRGLGVTLARAFPVNAIIFPVYEFVLLQLGDGD
jgi:solute carrier family 25 carnitine/acylcarnitine transporter 20/29